MSHTDTLRMIASLLAIVALIFALAWIARRTGWLRGQSTQTMRLLGTQSLGNARATLALVQIEDTRLVLGVTATHISLLHTLPTEVFCDTAKPATDQPAPFHTMLQAQRESSCP